MLNERGYRTEVIERQLAHKNRDKTRASYNQAEYLTERRAMMQDWANLIDLTTDGPRQPEQIAGYRLERPVAVLRQRATA